MSPEARRGRSVHIAGSALVVLAALGAVAFGARRSRAEGKDGRARSAEVDRGPRVTTVKAVAAPPSRPVILQGDVRAFRQATIYAKVSGYLQSIRVDRGDAVKEGQVLAVLESPETAQQELSAKADLTLRERTEERARSLASRGVVSRQELDNAAGGLDMARAEAARVKALRAYEVLRAPFDGRVTARYVDQGALLSAATSATASAQEILDVADLSRVRIFVYPGQVDASRIHEGDAATFWADSDPAARRTEKVTRVSHALDPRTRTMLVEVDADNGDESLRPGSFVHVQVTVPTVPGVVVPADSILLRSGAPFVALVRDGRAHYVAVEISDDDGKLARLAHGVTAGDQVIVHPSDDVLEDAAVIATELAAPKK